MNYYAGDELDKLHKKWINKVLDELLIFISENYNKSYDEALEILYNYYSWFNVEVPDESLRINIGFIIYFENTVFSTNVDDYREETNIINIPNGLHPDIINIIRKPLLDDGLIIRKISDNELITYFDKVYLKTK